MDFSRAFDPFRALHAAWTAVKQAPLPLLLGGILLTLSSGGGAGGGGWNGGGLRMRNGFDSEVMLPILLGMVGIACCVGIALFLFSSWIEIGFNNAVEEVVRTGRGDVGTVFEARGRYADMLLARLLCALIHVAVVLPFVLVVGGAIWATGENVIPEALGISIVAGVGLVCIVVILYVALGLGFVTQAVALEGRAASAALQRSWSVASGHRLQLLVYWIVLGLFTLAGICVCCIGVLFTAALARVAATESYLAWTRGDERPAWWIASGQVAETSEARGWSTRPPPPPPPITPPQA